MNGHNQTVMNHHTITGNGSVSRYSSVEEKDNAKRAFRGIKVLMYHRVVSDREMAESYPFCVHKDEFKKHLEVIDHLGYTPVTFNDYKLFTEGEIELPKKPVIITFDDGYQDTYTNAYPLLLEYGMRAVIFVMGDRSLETNVWDQSDNEIPVALLMNNDQIRELHAKGFEIGAHTMKHDDLQQLSGEDIYKELKGTKMILESLLDSPVQSLSYPFGSVNTQVKRLAQDAGYDFACSVYSGPAQFGDDPYEIRRLTIYNSTTLPGFIMRLKTPFEYVEWLWWTIKQARRQEEKKNLSLQNQSL
jgi:peptidoglycan/xylan/chitin deacetylase (PgdA/CDA1 family)